MRTIRLGASGIDVSAVGLGGIQFSKISARKTAGILHEANDLGVTFLETAHGYFDSEEKIGAALGRRRRGVVLASKSGARDGKTFTVQLDESLRRLRTDCIDIYQLHGVDSSEMLDQALRPRGAVRAAQKAIRQGKIRSLGITSHSLALSLKAAEMGLFESLQYPISLINTEVPRSGLLGKARAAGVGLIAMKPLGGGRLSNARLALGYIYRFRDVVPVVGVETAEQVRELVRIASRPPKLTPKHFGAIRRLRRSVGTTFCRACRYCEPCPQDIAIFRVLYFPVYVKQMGPKRVLKSGLPDWLARAETCTRCGRCERRCPFHLHIPDGLSASLSLARSLLSR
ncbi:MAG: aldo/keto reductase [Candidatus Brocadiia bacterium]|nr:aldo/keto reductase [Candidatus Brocadiia bacterium]